MYKVNEISEGQHRKPFEIEGAKFQRFEYVPLDKINKEQFRFGNKARSGNVKHHRVKAVMTALENDTYDLTHYEPPVYEYNENTGEYNVIAGFTRTSGHFTFGATNPECKYIFAAIFTFENDDARDQYQSIENKKDRNGDFGQAGREPEDIINILNNIAQRHHTDDNPPTEAEMLDYVKSLNITPGEFKNYTQKKFAVEALSMWKTATQPPKQFDKKQGQVEATLLFGSNSDFYNTNTTDGEQFKDDRIYYAKALKQTEETGQQFTIVSAIQNQDNRTTKAARANKLSNHHKLLDEFIKLGEIAMKCKNGELPKPRLALLNQLVSDEKDYYINA